MAGPVMPMASVTSVKVPSPLCERVAAELRGR